MKVTNRLPPIFLGAYGVIVLLEAISINKITDTECGMQVSFLEKALYSL